MRQALHIFQKDVRRFAYEISVLVLLTGGWVWAAIRHDRYYSDSARMMLVLVWWYLISEIIHEESLIGDRQFWITRPYSRVSLLAAKALFVLTFINLPLLLAGFAILGAAGYQPLARLSNFLWMQLTFTAVALVLPAALAALTRTLAQIVLTILGLLIGGFTLSMAVGTINTAAVYQSRGLSWTADIFPLFLGLALLCMLLLQSRTRNRFVSAGVGMALVILIMFADSGLRWRIGTAVQSHMFGQGAGSVEVDLLSSPIEQDVKRPDPTGVALAVPLRIGNIPEGETAAPEILELIFEAPGAQRWSSGWIAAASSGGSVFQSDPSLDHTFTWVQRVVIDRRFWEGARSRDVAIRGAVWTMLYTRSGVQLAEDRVTSIPGDGKCSASPPVSRPPMSGLVDCVAPFHTPFYTSESTGSTTRLISVWDSPFPAEFGMNPLASSLAVVSNEPIFFLRYDPRAYIQRSIAPATVQLK